MSFGVLFRKFFRVLFVLFVFMSSSPFEVVAQDDLSVEFYQLLNNFEIGEFNLSLEKSQVEYFRESFSEIIEEASAFYEPFKEWFHRYREEKI